MPQRPLRQRIYQWGQFERRKFTPTEQRALTRIGHEKGPAEELNWFIRLANAKLEEASEGEVLMLQEDFSALEKAYCDYLNQTHPTREQLIQVQQGVRKHLSELADQGQTSLPETPVQHDLTYPRRIATLRMKATGEQFDLPNELPDFQSQYLVLSFHNFTNLVYLM